MDQNVLTKWIKVADKATENYTALSKDERVWVNVRILIDSINNGGLISYYYNSGAENVYDLLDDLEIIEMTNVVEIIIKFNATLFPLSIVPKDIDLRNEIIGSIDEMTKNQMQTLENEIFSCIPDLEAHLDRFLETRF